MGHADPNADALRASHPAAGPDGWRSVVSAFLALGTHAHTDDFPEQEELRDIAAPTLVIHGDRDPFFPVAVPTALYGLLPDAELCILPRCGHTPVRERPEWREFLEAGALEDSFLSGAEFAEWLERADASHESWMRDAGLLAPPQPAN